MEGSAEAGCEEGGAVDCGPKSVLPEPNMFPPGVGAAMFVAPVLAPRPLFSFGGSPAGVVEPNGRRLVLGAAGVVDPKEGNVEVAVEEGAFVEAGGAPKLKAGVLEAVAPLDGLSPAKSPGLLPLAVKLLVVLFPNPPKPPEVLAVPNNDGAAAPVDFPPPNGSVLALPNVKGLEGSDMLEYRGSGGGVNRCRPPVQLDALWPAFCTTSAHFFLMKK